jgi:predicted DNA-binding protein with PD1-like motif
MNPAPRPGEKLSLFNAEKIPVREQVEVATLIGDVADIPRATRRFIFTLSLVLGEGHVRLTLEVIVTESPAHLRKVKDDETGLALIRPAA